MCLNLHPERIDPDASGTGLEKFLDGGKNGEIVTNNPASWVNLLTATSTMNREFDRVVGELCYCM